MSLAASIKNRNTKKEKDLITNKTYATYCIVANTHHCWQHACPPMKMEQTECSETLAYKNSGAGELPRRKHTTNIT